MRQLFLKFLMGVICIFLFLTSAFSQNDNCANASVVTISNSGYGIGVFTSTTNDLTGATVQSGETFAPAILVAGQNQKSIWYKFTVPTTRSVRVTLAQPGSAITNGDAGFAVYKTNNCLPANADISTKLTPIGVFGNTFHPCVEAGDYLVQVSGKSVANGPVYITVELGLTTAVYDHPAQAYDFGTLAVGVKAVDYNVDCQSTEDATEICTSLSNYTKYDKSTWHTFTTPAYFDFIAFLISGTNFFSPLQNKTIGYRIYQGDVKITPISGLTPLGNCDSIITNGYTPGTKGYKCSDLQPNTTYSIQLFFKEDFINVVRVAMTLGGTAPTQAPQPILSLVPASNRLGVLPAGNGGTIITTTATDQHACNAHHYLHPCNSSLPANGFVYNGLKYNLSTFFTFTLGNTSRLNISAINTYCGPSLLGRLYKQDLTNTCTTLDTSQIIAPLFLYSSNNINCLPPGNYTLQIMAQDTLIAYDNYYYGHLANNTYPLCIFNNLGDKFTLNIGVTNIQEQNLYSLHVPGAFDTLNASGGIMQPLQNGISYMNKIDTFGCANTVLPIDATICYPTTTKAIYREFAVADSGIVSMFYSGYYNNLWRGDADALATSQNVHNYPSRISGLTEYSECLASGFSCDGNKYCVVPDTYTAVTFGSDLQIGLTSQYQARFNIVNTVHNSPAKAENMGDILSQVPASGGSVASSLDYFSCKDNAVAINGYQPCAYNGRVATKAVYRQFYLSSPAYITITGNHNMPCGFTSLDINTLFSGKATDGIDSLHVKPAPWQCFITATETSTCPPPLPAGWYTIVTYGVGPSYEFPLRDVQLSTYSSSVGYSNQITITVNVPICPSPKYNRPYKASIDTITHQPYLIEWAPRVGHTSAYPKTDTTYTLYTEHYNCTVDTPFNLHPIVSCDPAMTKVTYYVFRTTQESSLMINTINQWGAVYSGDVRTDSTSYATATPIQPCLKSSGHIQLCKVPPGTYTLVIFADNNYTCTSVTPTIYIDKVGYSRFDYANNAYDFGVVPPDSLYHSGKVGDVNPLDPGRAASNDFIYCTTGASQTNPTDPSCGTVYNANIYNSGITWLWNPANYQFFNSAKRNLWYSFVVKEGGTVKVKVSTKTTGKTQYQYKFSVYKSNVDGTLPFSTVVSTGQVDSTMAQGLTLIATNYTYNYCSNNLDEVSFYRSPCSATAERYYILVENPNTYPYDNSGSQPNSQAEVSIRIDSTNAVQPLFDHYSQAFNIGTNLGVGTFQGATDSYSCATKDLTDPIYNNYPCSNKTLWYKFNSGVTGHVKFRLSVNGNTSSHYSWDEISLYRQVIPGDSTSAGLQVMNINNASVYDYTSNNFWGIQCINPGTYYILLTGCNMVNEYEHPVIQLIEDAGDFCSAPVVTALNGAGNSISSVIVDCHTIGTDYGEFNPMLTCPAGMLTTDYKTSWFRFDITGTDTLDVTTYLSENTNANSTDIKYRLMNGTCSAMQERSCVQDALTQDTYKCLPPGSYWIQVFTPVLKSGLPVLGTIDLHLNAIHHADTCAPINSCLSNANFQMQFDCTQNQNVKFINYSTYGSSVSYLWNFGYNGQTSSAVSPQFNYPALTTSRTYYISLTVLNNTCSGQSIYTDSIAIPARPSVNLGTDTSLCSGGTVILNATSHQGSVYLWQNGSINPTFVANINGIYNYFVNVTYNGCIARDTIRININPIIPQVQSKYQCNGTPILLDATRGLGEVHQWNTGATTAFINVFTPGVYWDDMYLNGCIIRDSFIVAAVAHPLGNDCQACFASQAVVLNATTQGANSYTWQNGATGAIFNATAAGLYWVDISFGSCSFRDSIVLSNLQPLLGNISASICQGQIYVLHNNDTVTVAGIYADTVRTVGGCDSLINTVNLAVQAVILNNSNASICAGQSYTLPWGTTVNTAGTYRDTMHYVSGCDSLRRTVNLTVQSPQSLIINANICAGQSYTLPWGTVVNTAGAYRDTLHYVSGCDSLFRTVNVTVQNTLSSTMNANICAGQSYTLPWGTVANTAGTYQDTLHYVTGCDSLLLTVNLVVQNFITSSVNANICIGQSYTLPWGIIVSSTGVYSDTLHYTSGCDSLRRTVNLTVQSPQSLMINANICAGQSYTLPWGTVVNTAGTYKDTLHYVTGCDSLIQKVNLTVQSPQSSIMNATICAGQSYTLPWGTIVNTAGTYQDTLHYISGCDSLRRTLSLTIQSPQSLTVNANVCAGQSYILPWGTQVNVAGIYRDTLHYITGCDSLRRTINLTVTPAAVSSNAVSICSNEFYTLPWGKVVNTTGNYRDTVRTAFGCDSLIRLVKLSVQAAPVTSVSKSNDVNCVIGISKLIATGGASYLWSPAQSLSNTTISNPIASPNTNTLYKVIVTAANGCVTNDSILVNFRFDNTANGYLVANSFTPNNDGINDCFGVPYWGRVADFSMIIFNRWGETVFKTTNPTECWDGNYKGVRQNTGAFIYQISATGICGKVYRKGAVLLIR